MIRSPVRADPAPYGFTFVSRCLARPPFLSCELVIMWSCPRGCTPVLGPGSIWGCCARPMRVDRYLLRFGRPTRRRGRHGCNDHSSAARGVILRPRRRPERPASGRKVFPHDLRGACRGCARRSAAARCGMRDSPFPRFAPVDWFGAGDSRDRGDLSTDFPARLCRKLRMGPRIPPAVALSGDCRIWSRTDSLR